MKLNELQTLSNDLNVITIEIKTYQRTAGEAIFEIGRRLKHVREHDLTHGDWEKWCKTELGMTPQHANRFIKVTNELGGSNRIPRFDLGVKALYEIATMPEEQRSIPHTIPSTGEVKTVDEMTVKEINEVKKELKRLQEEKENAERKLDEERRKPPKVETRIIEKEVDNTDYDTLDKLKEELSEKQRQLNAVIKQKELLEEKVQIEKEDAEEFRKLKEEISKLHMQKEDINRQIESATSLSALYVDIENFLNTKLAPIKYSRALTERRDSEVAMNNLREIINMVDEWSKEMKSYLPNENIIDAEVIG